MQKRTFQGLKRTFLHVSGFPPPYFDSEKETEQFIDRFSSKYGGGRLEHAKTSVSGPETHVNAYLMSSSTIF